MLLVYIRLLKNKKMILSTSVIEDEMLLENLSTPDTAQENKQQIMI